MVNLNISISYFYNHAFIWWVFDDKTKAQVENNINISVLTWDLSTDVCNFVNVSTELHSSN